MTISQHRLNACVAAAKLWIQQNEGMYAGMIPDSLVQAVVTTVLQTSDHILASANTDHQKK